MRTVKLLAGLAGAIILLVVAGLLAVWLLINPNDYKGRVAAAVKSSTGRELVLTGDIKLSVFPWLALQLGPASLGNPRGFGAEPFLAFKRAAVRISLWRLLHKQMQIQRVEIDGLDLRLRKDESGVGNWESFGQAPPRPANAPKEEVGGPVAELAGVRITNGRVSYQGVVIQKLDLETGAIGGHEVTPVRIGFAANRGVPDESLTLSAEFAFSADGQYQQLRFAGVSLSGLLNCPGDGRPAHWEASLPTIEVNLTAHTMSVPAYDLSYSSAHMTGKFQATNFLDDLSATGSVALAPLSLREFAPRLGLVLPKTRDPRVLAQLSASGDFRYGANALSFDSVRLQLDDTHLKGDAVLGLQSRALRFDLTVDQIDLDRYVAVEQGPAVPLKPAAAPAAGPETSKLPDTNGTLSVESVHFSLLDFTNVRLTFASKDSVVHLFPSLAQIDGGSYSGNVTLDERGALPILSMDEHLSGVDMARLLAATPYKGRLSGHGTVNLKATARGAAPGSVMQTLSGQFDASLDGGALEGIDLGYELAAAQALVKHQSVPSRSGPARTKFDAFRMSAQISSGVAKTTDLIIASPVLRVTGQGSANLVNKALDLQMLASLSKAPGATVADVPLKVTGTYLNPIVRPDVEALAKGELKQKLQDLLKKNGLQGLFGK
jgi:AsmA protein